MDSNKYDVFISYRKTDGEGRTSGTYIPRTIRQQLGIGGKWGFVDKNGNRINMPFMKRLFF